MIRIFTAALALAAVAGAACAQLDPQNMPAPNLPLTGTEIIPCDQNNGYKKCTASMLANQQTLAPNLLKFGPPTPLPYFDPQPSGLIDVTDGFTASGNYSTTGSTAPFTFTVSGGTGTVTTTGSGVVILKLTSDTTLLAPQFFNAIEVTAQTPASGYSNIYAGAFASASSYVGCYYDATGHAIHTEYNYGSIQNSSVKSITLTPPYVVGSSLVGNSLSCWYKTAPTLPWLYAGNVQTTANRDYTITANFASAGFKTGAFTSMGGAGSFTLSTLQGGRFGGVTMRDLKPVVNSDWTTYQPGANSIYFVASAIDPGATFGGSPAGQTGGSLGVFTLNLATMQITETGVICIARSTSGTAHTYCNDNAGNIIYHANGDREIVTSSWSDGWNNTNPVHVEYQYVTSGAQPDLLTTNLSVLSSVSALTLPLGTGGVCAYDPALAKIGATYYLAYTVAIDCTFSTASTVSNMFSALAAATTPTGTWTSVGIGTVASEYGGYEGTSFANVSGTLYELTGGPHFSVSPAINACSSARVYDKNYTYQGTLAGASLLSTPYYAATANASCSHPTLFQHPDGVHEVVLTFLPGQFNGSNLNTSGQPAIEISTP